MKSTDFPLPTLIVTGMHRSGTSAIARLINDLGFHIGSDLLPASKNNLHGHFEEAAFTHFHDRLIERFFPEKAPFCEWLPLADAPTPYSQQEREAAAALWEAHRASGATAWKDPRTSLFLDLWLEIVPEAKIVVCLRHPYQVHLSLLRRGEPALHVDYSAGIVGWFIYNLRILRALAAVPSDRVTVIDIDTAFRTPDRLALDLAGFLGVSLPSGLASIRPEEFHFEENLRTAFDAFASLFPEIESLYRSLQRFGGSASFPELEASRSVLSRLIEFEEANGLRKTAEKMLIRSLAEDRNRSFNLFRKSVEAGREKDRMIEDLIWYNGKLKETLRDAYAKGLSALPPAPAAGNSAPPATT